MNSRSLKIVSVIGLIWFSTPSFADHKVQFSKVDRGVLKEIGAIDNLADATGKLLLTAPVFIALQSPDAMDALLTISTTDWAQMATGASAMKRIAACKIQGILILHLQPGASDQLPTGEALKYFERLQQQSGRMCSP